MHDHCMITELNRPFRLRMTHNSPAYPFDRLEAHDGTPFTMHFFRHASLAIELCGKWIYTDPVGSFADYASLPKADLILVSHHHYDHLEIEAVRAMWQPSTQILCDHTSAAMLSEAGFASTILRPGETATPYPFLTAEAVAAYNTSEGHLQFHPREREDIGFVLRFGGTRLYIAGDGEPTPEMLSLRDIDIALLPVNQPYTMTVEQAAEVVKTLRPRIFYPYHYGQVEEITDLARLQREVDAVTDMRIRGME